MGAASIWHCNVLTRQKLCLSLPSRTSYQRGENFLCWQKKRWMKLKHGVMPQRLRPTNVIGVGRDACEKPLHLTHSGGWLTPVLLLPANNESGTTWRRNRRTSRCRRRWRRLSARHGSVSLLLRLTRNESHGFGIRLYLLRMYKRGLRDCLHWIRMSPGRNPIA